MILSPRQATESSRMMRDNRKTLGKVRVGSCVRAQQVAPAHAKEATLVIANPRSKSIRSAFSNFLTFQKLEQNSFKTLVPCTLHELQKSSCRIPQTTTIWVHREPQQSCTAPTTRTHAKKTVIDRYLTGIVALVVVIVVRISEFEER